MAAGEPGGGFALRERGSGGAEEQREPGEGGGRVRWKDFPPTPDTPHPTPCLTPDTRHPTPLAILLQTPNFNAVVLGTATSTHDSFAIRTKSHRFNFVCMTGKGLDRIASANIPNFHLASLVATN